MALSGTCVLFCWQFSIHWYFVVIFALTCFIMNKIVLKSLRPSDAYICVGNQTIIGSGNGLSPGRGQWWNIVNWTIRNKISEILKYNSYIFIQQKVLAKIVCNLATILSWPQCVDPIGELHQSHNASVTYPTMHHFVTEKCTYVHISVTKWCIVGYLSDALWDLWDGSITPAIVTTGAYRHPHCQRINLGL